MRFKNRPDKDPVAATPEFQPPELVGTIEFIDPRIGFPVTILTENVDAVYEALGNTIEEESSLINAMLHRPVNKVKIDAQRTKGSFMLYGSVELEDEQSSQNVFTKITAAIDTLYPLDAIERRANALIVADETSKILLAQNPNYSEKNQLIVSTGLIKEGYRKYSEAFSSPENTPEQFKNSLQHVIGGLTLSLAIAYDLSDIKPEPQRIVLRTPYVRESLQLFDREDSTPTPEDISKQFGVEFPRVAFDEIGGQAKAKEEIKSLAYALTHPEMYQKWGTRAPKGILLHGPPGTGKTLLAKALASETSAAFFAITPSDITAKYYGESEKRIDGIFNAAATHERAIIYFDELDAIMPDRNKSGHEVTQRIVSMILQHMDGMRSKDNVIIVASTNRMDAIEPAMLRPGRLDKLVAAELPDKSDRIDIFTIHKQHAEALANRALFKESISFETLASLTDTYSGADISEIIRRTLEMKVRSESMIGLEPDLVDLDDISYEIEQYERTKTRTSE